MVKLELKTIEECNLWRTMQKELKQHSSYHVKQTYFPYNMDAWYEMKKTIERKYRSKIEALQCVRKQMEQEESIQEAAEALLLLKKVEERKEFYKKRRSQPQTASLSETKTVRRSVRIANKNK